MIEPGLDLPDANQAVALNSVQCFDAMLHGQIMVKMESDVNDETGQDSHRSDPPPLPPTAEGVACQSAGATGSGLSC